MVRIKTAFMIGPSVFSTNNDSTRFLQAILNDTPSSYEQQIVLTDVRDVDRMLDDKFTKKRKETVMNRGDFAQLVKSMKSVYSNQSITDEVWVKIRSRPRLFTSKYHTWAVDLPDEISLRLDELY